RPGDHVHPSPVVRGPPGFVLQESTARRLRGAVRRNRDEVRRRFIGPETHETWCQYPNDLVHVRADLDFGAEDLLSAAVLCLPPRVARDSHLGAAWRCVF